MFARTCADVVAGVVTKCLNARAKTKEGGIAVCLMYVEIEQQAVVQVWSLIVLSILSTPFPLVQLSLLLYLLAITYLSLVLRPLPSVLSLAVQATGSWVGMRDWGYLCVVCICGSARLKMCLCSHISISSKCRTSSKGWSSCVCRVAAVDICAALSLLKSSRLLPSFLVMRLKSWEGAWERLTDSSEPWTEYCTQDYCTWWSNDWQSVVALQEEIMKGLSNKQPKIVLGSIQVLKMMLQWVYDGSFKHEPKHKHTL